MASIIERNGRYLVRVRRQGYPTVTKTFTRKSDGVAWSRRVEVEMESGRWTKAPRHTPTLREVIQEYRRVVGHRLKGAQTYKYRYDEFERLPFAGKRMNDVTSTDLAIWRDQQLAIVKPATALRKLAMLSGIFRWAERERGWVDKNPVLQVTKPRQSAGRTRTLSDIEVVWLLKAASTSKAAWLRAALVVLMQTAMRRGELCSLHRQDIDFVAATAHLHDTKNGAARDVPLCPQALAALTELCASASQRGEDRVLPIRPAGSLSTRFNVTVRRAQAMYADHCRECLQEPANGFLSDLRLHDLRHHAVTAWTRSGALSVAELMAISGHKTTRMLIRYTHLQPRALAKKLAAIASQGTE